jgi:2-hydroxychromene-2-carboxylate isomerase
VLTVYFDYPSPASVVALLRLQPLADEGLDVRFVGVDVLGLATPLPMTLDQFEELERHGARAAALGLALRRPTSRPPTLDAHLVGEAAEAAGLGASWRAVCLRGYWQDGRDLGDHDTLRALASDAGLAADAVAAVLGDREARLRRRQHALQLRSRGVGGVPVVEVAGGTLVSADLPDAELRALAAL